MKQVLVAVLLLFAATSYANQEAITDTGEKVILKNDGTWVYADKASKSVQKLDTNKKKFEKPGDSTFLVKSTRNNSAFWINSAKWNFKKAQENAASEYQFSLKTKDLYAMAITEGIEMPVESLAEIALSNAKSAATDIKLVTQEYRIVNGKKVIYMQFNCTVKGMNLIYNGYYYSNTSGSTQLVTYTSANATEKYMADITDFLNGLVTQ